MSLEAGSIVKAKAPKASPFIMADSAMNMMAASSLAALLAVSLY